MSISTIIIQVLFVPSREIFQYDLIENLQLIKMTFQTNDTITQIQNSIIKYINDPNNIILKSTLITQYDKVHKAIIQLYETLFDIDLQFIKTIILENYHLIVSGNKIPLQGLFKPLTPTIIKTLTNQSEIVLPYGMKNDSIILCEYYQNQSIFSSFEEIIDSLPNSLQKPLQKYNIGLVNIGNSCYINSCIQCLLSCREIAEYFLLTDYEKDINPNTTCNDFITAFVYIINIFWQKPLNDYNPQSFGNIFKKHKKEFRNGEQQDLEQFLSAFINLMQDSFNEQKSIFDTLFNGNLQSIHRCSMCKNETKIEEKFIHLSLPIIDNTSQSIVCFFHFYNYNHLPFKVSYALKGNITIQDFKESIAKALDIPLSSFHLYLYNPRTLAFNYITGSNIKYIHQLKLVENELHLILMNPYLFSITLDTLLETFQTLIDEKDHFHLQSRELKCDNHDLTNYIKIIIKHNVYKENNNGQYSCNSVNIIPNVFYIKADSNLEHLYIFLNNFFSKIFSKIISRKTFQLKNKSSLSEIQLKNLKGIQINEPLILLFDKLQPINSPIEYNSNFKTSSQGIIMPNNETIKLKDIFKKYGCRDGNDNDFSKDEMIMTVAWDKSYHVGLKQLNDSVDILIPSFDSQYGIYNCFKEFFKKESLSVNDKVFCDKCNVKQIIEKQIQISNIPEILVIVFKRSLNNVVNKTKITFPLNGLDISQYVDNSIEENNNIKLYDLFAVANHTGDSRGGHYTAYTKNSSDNKWYSFSDLSVESIDENIIESSNSYVLFYKKAK